MKKKESRLVINDYHRIRVELEAATSIEEYIGIVERLINNNYMYLKPKQKLSRTNVELLLVKNEFIEFENFETLQQVTTLFRQHGVTLIRKFRDLLSELFKNDTLAFADLVETLWELDMKFSTLMRMYSKSPDNFFAPSWHIYILVEEEKKEDPFAIPIDYLKLTRNEAEEINNTRKAIRSFCENAREMIQMTSAKLSLTKHKFSRYKLPENIGGRFVYELSKSLTTGKNPYLSLSHIEQITFRNQLADFFGVDQKKLNTAVKESSRRKIPNKILKGLSDRLE